VPLDDKPTYDLLARGDTLVSSSRRRPMRALLRSMRPDKLRGHLGRRARMLPARPDGGQRAQRHTPTGKNNRKPVVAHAISRGCEPLADILGDHHG